MFHHLQLQGIQAVISLVYLFHLQFFLFLNLENHDEKGRDENFRVKIEVWDTQVTTALSSIATSNPDSKMFLKHDQR
jgi:2,3-bisphosphoglycerate-independent phosphoglycerate mutase